MVNWVNLLFPFIYLGALVGLLSTFSKFYRARKAHRARTLAPWFEHHRSREIYLSLLAQDDDESKPSVPEPLLRAALLRRATEDVGRVMDMRQAKPALSQLLHRGSIGEDVWQRFLRAEQETEEEIRDVVNEANIYQDNWGSYIFQSAHEILQNHLMRKHIAGLQGTAEEEREWWAKRQQEIQTEFMKELDQEAAGGQKRTSDDEAVLVEAVGPTSGGHSGKKKKKGKN